MRFCLGIALAASYISTTTMLANFFAPHTRARLLSINGAMFSIALLVTGSIGALVGDNGWRVLLRLGAISPVIVALLVLVYLPDDRKFCVYANAEEASNENLARGSWWDMFSGRRRWLTIACLLLAGLNFSGYQFYSGFITTYLINVRHWPASLAGLFVTIDGLGTLVGSVLWGWIADRIGRRANAIGFAITAAFISGFLIAPRSTPLLCALEFGYALCLSATNCWGAYFAELFPVRLRPMGTALFHGGHVIALIAPLIVATVARSHSLAAGMALAPATFLAASILWWFLPETLRTSRLYRGFNAEEHAI
jgi:MFS family permease